MTTHILNMIKCNQDSRDYIYGSDSNSFPNKLDYRKDLLDIRDQGTQGACFAFASCSMKEWQEKKDYNLIEELSPQFLYDHRSNIKDNDTNNDEGMYSRDVMKLLQKVGICMECDYNYGLVNNIDTLSEQDKKKIYNCAEKNKIKAYARIFTINGLKKALTNNGPCLICVPTYHEGNYIWRKNLTKSKDNETMLGGHAMAIVGWDDNYIVNKERGYKDTIGAFIIRNSWGKNWADNGYTYFPYADWDIKWEVWTTIDSKTELIQDSESNLELNEEANDVEEDSNQEDKECDISDCDDSDISTDIKSESLLCCIIV